MYVAGRPASLRLGVFSQNGYLYVVQQTFAHAASPLGVVHSVEAQYIAAAEVQIQDCSTITDVSPFCKIVIPELVR